MEKLVTASEMMGRTLQVLSSSEEAPAAAPAEAFDVLGALGRAGFPDKFLRTDWKTPDFVLKHMPPESREGLKNFLGLCLTGKTGRKKTSSLCLLARDWLTKVGQRGSKVWGFVSFPEVCVQLQEAWLEGGGGPMRIINKLASTPILIVDDVGAEKTSDFVLQAAYLIFNKREFAQAPTYITSNLSVDEISEKLDDRIGSRIKGMCSVIPVGGEDQRGRP